jgi:hypothetical protein
MKTTFVAMAALVVYTSGCAPSGPGPGTYKVTAIYEMHFSADEPALVLEYETAIPIDDMAALRREVEGIWEDFRPRVEKAGLKFGAIRATHYESGLVFRRGRGYGFAFAKGADGQWRPLPEAKTPASDGRTRQDGEQTDDVGAK